MIDLRATTHAVDAIAENLPSLAGAVVRASVVLACGAFVAMLMRRASAATRHLVWTSAILVALVLPLIGRVAPQWNARVLPPAAALTMTRPPAGSIDIGNAGSAQTDPVAALAEPGHVEPLSAAFTAPAKTVVSGPPALSATGWPFASWSFAKWIVIAWIAGALLVLGRLAIGTVVIWNIARRAAHVDDASWVMLARRTARELGITRPITLLASDSQVVPVTWGVVYPIILLPASALEWEDERRSAVLVHELAHVGRLDALTQTLTQLAAAIFWFNPLVWIAVKQIRLERERACDDLVLSHGTRASFYADDLLSMVRMLSRDTEPAFAALAMARRSEFEGRMLAILDPRTDRRRLGRRGPFIAALASLVVALPVAALRPLPRDLGVTRTRASTVASIDPATHSAHSITHGVTIPESELATTTKGSSDTVNSLETPPKHAGSVVACSSSSGMHTSIHSDDNQSSYVFSDDSRCIIATSNGKITYSDDDSRIQSIAPGGHITITEVKNGVTRRYEGSSDNGTVDGKFSTTDKSVQPGWGDAWLKEVVLRLVRQDASQVQVRLARIRSQRGVSGVLTEINAIDGDYAKRAYLDALLSSGHLTPDTLRLVTQIGARTLTSDYDRAEFLKRAGALAPNANGDILATAASSMSSSFYTRELMTSALVSAGDKEAVAKQIIAKANSMSSDYDVQSLLVDVLHHVKLSEPVLLSLIAASNKVSSDYYHAAILDSVLETQSVTSSKVDVALAHSASTILGSDYYRAAVLERIAQNKDLSAEAAIVTLTSAKPMSADIYKANVLVAVACTSAIKDSSVREAFFAAAKTIQSGSDYRRAMSTILP